MLRLACSILAAAPLFIDAAVAQSRQTAPQEIVRPAVAVGRCGMINIGTPERPRLVKDPACSRSSR